MLDSTLYSINKLDALIKKLAVGFEDLIAYNFEGANYNEINFKRLLIFYDDDLFEKASFKISQQKRWINAYYWYSVYLKELLMQKISIENHRQTRFKLIEQIDYCSGSDFDWSIIDNIDKEFNIN